MHFRNPNIYEVFIECLKKVSASNLSWSMKENGDLVCTEQHVPHDTQNDAAGRKHSVKQIMHDLRLKMMPNEYKSEQSADKSTTTYIFSKKPLIDQINTLNSKNQFMVRRLKEWAQKTDERRQSKKM